METDFSDNTAKSAMANGYKPVMKINTVENYTSTPKSRSKFLSVLIIFFKGLVAIIVLAIIVASITGFVLFGIPKIQDRSMAGLLTSTISSSDESTNKYVSDEISSAETNIKNYQKQLLLLAPKTPYLIINTTENEFHLYSGNQLIRTGKCSTGSNTILQKSAEKKWIFQTPRGAMRIRGKITSPIWVKPDWAFIEEGLPVPSARHPSRYEAGSLGDYAMSLGDGYMIHGTLYKRLLGMPVTHGCIRMNDEDLEVIYNTVLIGSKVYIY